MKYKIKSGETGITIDINQTKGKQKNLLEAFHESPRVL
jgi:hypothetical protein